MGKIYRREFANIDSKEDRDLTISLLSYGLHNSRWVLNSGLDADSFFDLDDFVVSNKDNRVKLVRWIRRSILALSETVEFNKIAFIDKKAGPVGLISLFCSIADELNFEFLFVRPKKLLLSATIKGSINPKDRVLLLSDVATTGETLFDASTKIKQCGGKISGALVVIDRNQGATENLSRAGVTLYSLVSWETIKNNPDWINEFTKLNQNKDLKISSSVKHIDFGTELKQLVFTK